MGGIEHPMTHDEWQAWATALIRTHESWQVAESIADLGETTVTLRQQLQGAVKEIERLRAVIADAETAHGIDLFGKSRTGNLSKELRDLFGRQ